ncbi:MAG: hypothetical protein ACRDJW_10520 [Thermomicrobiales bacterium]
MTRIDGVDPQSADLDPTSKAAFEAQRKKWGTTLISHTLYARRPSIFRAARGMWGGLDASGLLDPKLVALVNRRVAFHNGCVF